MHLHGDLFHSALLNLHEDKPPTFAQARDALLDGFRKAGWAVSGPLKIPHATSPDGTMRLWFKPQAVIATYSSSKKHVMGEGHSVAMDLRGVTVDRLIASAERYAQETGKERDAERLDRAKQRAAQSDRLRKQAAEREAEGSATESYYERVMRSLAG